MYHLLCFGSNIIGVNFVFKMFSSLQKNCFGGSLLRLAGLKTGEEAIVCRDEENVGE